jgi:pre-rRNA-processing protein TSR3
MQTFPVTYIWRHRKENKKKCSLRGLESRQDMQFFSYPNERLPDLSSYFMLTLDPKAPIISREDADLGLLLIDGTWNYAGKMVAALEEFPASRKRALPANFETAYPRRQEGCCDPRRGLASVEALFIAYLLMGRDVSGLLDGYYWKQDFLTKNKLNIPD